jgi:aminoglycoside/choline kinase family phosphotransferase
MHSHPYFDLPIHDDAELSELIGSPIHEQVTLHEWPLSCVQRITLADGQRWIYKSQAQPSVEAQFYARVKSSLLPAARLLWEEGGKTILLLEYLGEKTMEDKPMGGKRQVMNWGHVACEKIAALPTDLPCYLDVGTLPRWRTVMGAVIENLRGFIQQGIYTRLTLEQVGMLERAAFSSEVVELFEQPPCLAHGDLTMENMFLLPGGLRVVDWQRPLLAPPGLDLATFIQSSGMAVRQHFRTDGVLHLRALLTVHWLSECTRQWFPPGAETYDRQIAEITSAFLV